MTSKIIIQSLTPMMADVVSGEVPRPLNLLRGQWPHEAWSHAAPALREHPVTGEFIAGFGTSAIKSHQQVRELRQALSTRGPAWISRAGVVVSNCDGTRVAFFADGAGV